MCNMYVIEFYFIIIIILFLKIINIFVIVYSYDVIMTSGFYTDRTDLTSDLVNQLLDNID